MCLTNEYNTKLKYIAVMEVAGRFLTLKNISHIGKNRGLFSPPVKPHLCLAWRAYACPVPQLRAVSHS